jgi:hypothetical protein
MLRFESSPSSCRYRRLISVTISNPPAKRAIRNSLRTEIEHRLDDVARRGRSTAGAVAACGRVPWPTWRW